MLHGSLGFSYVDFQPVLHRILLRLAAAAELMVSAIPLSYVLAITIGARLGGHPTSP